jgi:hypothetical protein
MKETGLTVTFAAPTIRSQCAGLLPRTDTLTDLQWEDYDADDELADAAFLIVVAFGSFVIFVSTICWMISA